jgi:phosphomannomutase
VSIYQPCDIRGDAVKELTPQLYRRWGRALGRQVAAREKFVVGGDVRASTEGFLSALIEGLCEAGVDVVDLGILPTPMIFYAKHRLQAAACAIVTGSHHAAAINGLRWMTGQRCPTPDDIALLQCDADCDHDADAERNESSRKVDGRPPIAGRTPSTSRMLDISFDYVASLQETFADAIGAEQHVVLDPMRGCWAGRVRRYSNAIFPRCLFSIIRNERDPNLGGRAPDCSHLDELHELCDAVYRERAHVGFAFDGDGDRLAVVDDEGVVLSSDEITWLCLQSLGAELAGQAFVHDMRLSDRIVEAARRFDAEPVVERSGPTRIRDRMRRSGALFGMESGGHYFHRAWPAGDDSLFTACRLIAWLAAQSGETLADLRRRCPAMYRTPDLPLPLDAQAQSRMIEEIRAAWSHYPQQTIDGVRIDTPSGWILVSSSVTEPSLNFRFEGVDWNALDHLVEQFCATLPEWGDALWQEYRAAMGMEES